MYNHTSMILTHPSGECGEHGNTPLWDALLRAHHASYFVEAAPAPDGDAPPVGPAP